MRDDPQGDDIDCGRRTRSFRTVKMGPCNRPTQKEREEHEATHVAVQMLVHTLRDGQRTNTSPQQEQCMTSS